ncbi:tRNA (5-methylaminomethyl-2-thiouridine)(34)-methyltransferase MnmD [Myxacorys almedinensis]|nr:MnmC family methyltransferase [Myxacorys almedinensis]
MSWTHLLTQDGSYTFFSSEFGEAFHSRQGAKTEAFQKFADATRLAQKAQQPSLKLLDVCYGLGYNTAAALEVIWAVNPACRVELYGLELDATVPMSAIALLEPWAAPIQEVLTTLAKHQVCQHSTLEARVLIGDARQTIQSLMQGGFQADAIFLDPFSPRRCPQLWTVDFFQRVASCLAQTGILSTYSRSASVRTALIEAGLKIGTIPLGEVHGSHDWAQGTIAAWGGELLEPLSQMEQEHLQTRAAIPYRDPCLNDGAETILARQAQEQRSVTVESTSSWRRRWGIS